MTSCGPALFIDALTVIGSSCSSKFMAEEIRGLFHMTPLVLLGHKNSG